ncbi:MAG: DNA/RNA helicase domain-containing protein [Limisphaerales bacterium]
MIVYLANKQEFVEDVFSNQIEDKILAAFKNRCGKSVGRSELGAWKNSMSYMHHILVDDAIPHDAGVAIEFTIPQSAKRIDFILTGMDSNQKRTAVIIELKQWTEAEVTEKDAIVRTFVGGCEREMTHPSYQAWSYAALLNDFNEAVRKEPIALQPCAYLHNCITRATIYDQHYQKHTDRAPAFLKDDALKLKNFIKQFVKRGDSGEAMYRIRDGRICPSKSLADCLVSMLQGNREFLMIDDQKLVYETALHLAQKSTNDNKNVLIVDGGPGTGKSVVAVNLLVELTAKEQVVQYVTKNAVPRAVYESKLTGSMTKTRISNLFTGSGSYTDTKKNTFDSLIVDEAHRLNEKSGMFQNLGENQIKEIIESARFSVFFIDENQRVTFKDIGRKQEIKRWAAACGAKVHEGKLESQFRCNGSDGYLAWVDDVLGIRSTANQTMEGVDYEFKVCNSANELRDLVIERNKLDNKSRMVAGYCWDWASQKSPAAMDIEIDDSSFKAQWNLRTDGSLWILKSSSVGEVGCIHTCQGLELDYVGVILGPDFMVRDGIVQTSAENRSRMDSSVRGFRKMLKANPDLARKTADEIIKNTYRTLMTRGRKGCFIYSTDPETNEYFTSAARGATLGKIIIEVPPAPMPPFRILAGHELDTIVNAVPIFEMKMAAGAFSPEQWLDECKWAELNEPFVAKKGYFIAQVMGESMNRRIPNGSWCLFRKSPEGSRQGRVVLVQHRAIQDPDSGRFTVKVYDSEKIATGDSWEHKRIILRPDSRDAGFEPIVLHRDDAAELAVIGEFVAVMG